MPSARASSPTPVIAWWKGALAGLTAGAAALAAGEFIGGLLAPTPAPVAAVANRLIDNAPQWLDELGKRTFGLHQKSALVIGTVVLALLFATLLGVVARRWPALGTAGITGFGILGMVSIAQDAQGSPGAGLIIALTAVVAGVATLWVLLSTAEHRADAPADGRAAPTIAAASAPLAPRRSFVGWVAGAGALAALSAFAGRAFRERTSAQAARETVELVGLDAADDVAAAVSKANSTVVATTEGITPIVVPNADFYRIDTALIVPQVKPDDWSLTIGGMVDAPRSYSFDELVERAQLVAPVTLSCVSNEVGGGLVGNAVWQGVPLTDLLDDVGVQPGATQISSRSVDGWTCGFPTDLAYDGRTAMVAIAMNDEALPIEHGFPARLVVSGLYGYVSATKWIEQINMTTLEDFNGYWIPRGWSKDGPVKTQSRIDTPRSGSGLAVGVEKAIAGVAWAPNIGIELVEVQIDDEPWIEAELGESLGINAWRQWRVQWTPTGGDHRIRVRATDMSGFTQPEERTPVAPDGASGWHTINLNV